MIIGEVGAGDGYFTFKISKRVAEEGRIYANDINKNALSRLREKADKDGFDNITTVLGAVEDPLFPVTSLDMIVMVMVYHELEKPQEMFRNLKKYLKPEANVVIIERDPDKWNKGWDHFKTKEELLSTVRSAGYELLQLYDFLMIDNVFIFHPISDAEEI